jgi:hypothetical protein
MYYNSTVHRVDVLVSITCIPRFGHCRLCVHRAHTGHTTHTQVPSGASIPTHGARAMTEGCDWSAAPAPQPPGISS